MTVPVVAFFNNKGGVGKTALVYHLSWMLADLGVRVVAADLDPQANLTAAFLDEDRLEELWPDGEHPNTVYGSVRPLMGGTGDIADPHVEGINEFLALLPGDLALSGFEDDLSEVWPKCMDGDERSFRVISAFWRIAQQAAISTQASAIFIDLGPNLGAINRAALIASDYVVVPLSPDLFSLQGLRNLGPTLRRWREQWTQRLKENPLPELVLPAGRMQPIGYIILQHSVRLDRPVKAYERWIDRIPEVYQTAVLNESFDGDISGNANSLGLLKHYRSLMPLAQEAHKPMFHLKSADGALGAHLNAVREAYQAFEHLAREIAGRIGLEIPARPG